MSAPRFLCLGFLFIVFTYLSPSSIPSQAMDHSRYARVIFYTNSTTELIVKQMHSTSCATTSELSIINSPIVQTMVFSNAKTNSYAYTIETDSNTATIDFPTFQNQVHCFPGYIEPTDTQIWDTIGHLYNEINESPFLLSLFHADNYITRIIANFLNIEDASALISHKIALQLKIAQDLINENTITTETSVSEIWTKIRDRIEALPISDLDFLMRYELHFLIDSAELAPVQQQVLKFFYSSIPTIHKNIF